MICCLSGKNYVKLFKYAIREFYRFQQSFSKFGASLDLEKDPNIPIILSILLSKLEHLFNFPTSTQFFNNFEKLPNLVAFAKTPVNQIFSPLTVGAPSCQSSHYRPRLLTNYKQIGGLNKIRGWRFIPNFLLCASNFFRLARGSTHLCIYFFLPKIRKHGKHL